MKNDMTRLYSFDALKVLSIYMVIVGHVLFYSFHEANNLVWQFIDVVNMPMFMFISGFFSGIPTAKGVLKRLRTLILPTLMVGMLYTFCKFNPNHNILLSLTVVGIISAIVLFGTLLLTKFIETSKVLSILLLGKIK